MLLLCDPSTSRKSLTLKYYAKKILYFLRQQNILRSLKTFMEQPADQQSSLEGEAGISVKRLRLARTSTYGTTFLLLGD